MSSPAGRKRNRRSGPLNVEKPLVLRTALRQNTKLQWKRPLRWRTARCIVLSSNASGRSRSSAVEASATIDRGALELLSIGAVAQPRRLQALR